MNNIVRGKGEKRLWAMIGVRCPLLSAFGLCLMFDAASRLFFLAEHYFPITDTTPNPSVQKHRQPTSERKEHIRLNNMKSRVLSFRCAKLVSSYTWENDVVYNPFVLVRLPSSPPQRKQRIKGVFLMI